MSGLRVVDVEDLGYEAALVHIDGDRLLLIDAALNHDDRMDFLTRAMDQVDE